MKILFVASGNSKTGITPLIKNQFDSLKNQNISVDVFPIKGKGLINYIRHIFPLRNQLKIKKYDIIHAHYGLCGIIAYCAKRKEKLVVSFMGDDLIGSINKKGQYSMFGDLLVYMNKVFNHRYNYVITKSKQLSDKVNNKKKIVLPNGVDLKKFYLIDKVAAREKINFPKNKVLLIFVSDPSRPEKNFSLAQEAMQHLNNSNVKLLPIHGIKHTKLNYYYSAADVLILTSHHEGSPNVIKEAMACNCPIVSTDVGDVKWIFGNTEGCYITSFDSNDVANKINMAFDYVDRNRRTKGRERIIELGISSEMISKKIIEIYEQVINS